MDLPFSPSFFKRLEVYQELKDFEEEGKDTWEYEKRILVDAVTWKDKPVGSKIERRSIFKIVHHFPIKSDKDHKTPEIFDILNSIVVRGYAYPLIMDIIGQADGITLNSKGYIAGRVLKETKGLKKVFKYQFWIKMWYAVIWVAFLLLILQVANSLKAFFQN